MVIVAPLGKVLVRSEGTNSIPLSVPMRAALNKSPGNLVKESAWVVKRRHNPHPCLFLSTSLGATERTYVHVQMNNKMTKSKDWKLKRADYKISTGSDKKLDLETITCHNARCTMLEDDYDVATRRHVVELNLNSALVCQASSKTLKKNTHT